MAVKARLIVMRILLVNKFSCLEGEVGGATRYILELFDTLRRHGHQVAFFSVKPLGEQSAPRDGVFAPWRAYWVSGVQTKRVEFSWQGVRTAFRFLWSFEAARNMEKLIRDFQPDIVHLNSFSQQISPSILPVIKRAGIPMIMTVHDYELIYPDYALKVDQLNDCDQKNYWNVVKRRDIKGSFAASFWKWLQFTFHRRLGVYHGIDLFLCPSGFMRDMLIQHGFQESAALPNCVTLNTVHEQTPMSQSPTTILYFGRMTPEKGVMELLEAYAMLKQRTAQIPMLVLLGNGMRGALEERIQAYGLSEHVSLLPFDGFEPIEEYQRAAFVVAPSFPFLENYPYAVLNAFAMKKAVLGSGLGGMQEMIHDGVNGWNVLGQTENVSRERYIERLSHALERAIRTPDDELRAMGQRGYEYVSKLTPEWYYDELMKMYETIMHRSETNNQRMSPLRDDSI